MAAWADRGPQSLTATQGDNTRQPLYSATDANGRPAVVADGQNDFLRTSSLNAHTGGASFYAVLAPQTANSSRYVWVIHSSSGGNQSGMIIGYESGGSGGKVEHFNVPRTDLGPSDVGVYGVYEFVNEGSGGSRWGRLNGALGQTGSGANQSWNANEMVSLFSSRTGDYSALGLAELIAYGRGLLPQEAKQVRQYLGTKYGIPVT